MAEEQISLFLFPHRLKGVALEQIFPWWFQMSHFLVLAEFPQGKTKRRSDIALHRSKEWVLLLLASQETKLCKPSLCKLLPTDFLNVDEQNTFGDTWTQMTIGACCCSQRIIRIGSLIEECVIVVKPPGNRVTYILDVASVCCYIKFLSSIYPSTSSSSLTENRSHSRCIMLFNI